MNKVIIWYEMKGKSGCKSFSDERDAVAWQEDMANDSFKIVAVNKF